MKLFICYLAIAAFLFSCTQKETADKIYFNAKIWTGDSAQPFAEAIAIKDNKIIFVGKDYEALKGSNTTMIDVAGKMIVPGFIDNHTHFLTGGYNLASVDLRKAKTKEEFISILKTYCQQHPGDEWIQGGDWDHEAWG